MVARGQGAVVNIASIMAYQVNTMSIFFVDYPSIMAYQVNTKSFADQDHASLVNFASMI